MSLSALALAAALQATPAVGDLVRPPRIPGQRSALECRQRATSARAAEDLQVQPLKRMPPGLLHHAVIRLVDGCPVSTRVRQDRPAR